MHALSEIGPPASELAAFFEVDCGNGSASAPFVAEAPSEQVFSGQRSVNSPIVRFRLPPGALSHMYWVRFRSEISDLLDAIGSAGQADEVAQAGVKKALEAVADRIEAFDFPGNAQIYRLEDFFKSCLFGLTPARQRVSPVSPSATTLIISLPGRQPMALDAYSSDGQIQDVDVLLQSLLPEGVYLDTPIGDWLLARRDYFRDCDPRWGRLAPALIRLARVGHEAVKWNQDGVASDRQAPKRLLIRVGMEASEDVFEYAELQVGPESLAQWRQAGLEYPEDFLAEAERQSLSAIRGDVARDMDVAGPSGSPDQIHAEIASLREEVPGDRNKLTCSGSAPMSPSITTAVPVTSRSRRMRLRPRPGGRSSLPCATSNHWACVSSAS